MSQVAASAPPAAPPALAERLFPDVVEPSSSHGVVASRLNFDAEESDAEDDGDEDGMEDVGDNTVADIWGPPPSREVPARQTATPVGRRTSPANDAPSPGLDRSAKVCVCSFCGAKSSECKWFVVLAVRGGPRGRMLLRPDGDVCFRHGAACQVYPKLTVQQVLDKFLADEVFNSDAQKYGFRRTVLRADDGVRQEPARYGDLR